MTIADRQHAAAVRRLSVAPTPALRWIAIRWDVRDGDLRGVLEWRITDDAVRRADVPAAVAIWQPESAATGSVVASVASIGAGMGAGVAPILRARDASGLEHLDIPGLLAVTLHRGADGAAAVVYARTSLLGTLGVRGGRTDSPQGAIVRSAHDDPAMCR